uniref:Uncharacterized protein n=1 Tax=Ditylenchus dipsaci TaxID=166011 RepID=A0A915DCQ3_9BILA
MSDDEYEEVEMHPKKTFKRKTTILLNNWRRNQANGTSETFESQKIQVGATAKFDSELDAFDAIVSPGTPGNQTLCSNCRLEDKKKPVKMVTRSSLSPTTAWRECYTCQNVRRSIAQNAKLFCYGHRSRNNDANVYLANDFFEK